METVASQSSTHSTDDPVLRDWVTRVELHPIPLAIAFLFEAHAMEVWRSGLTHYAARAVLHDIRHRMRTDMGDRSFKVNNNWSPALSRWFLRMHPEVGDFFRTRASPSRGGPRHSTEDYMGPFA